MVHAPDAANEVLLAEVDDEVRRACSVLKLAQAKMGLAPLVDDAIRRVARRHRVRVDTLLAQWEAWRQYDADTGQRNRYAEWLEEGRARLRGDSAPTVEIAVGRRSHRPGSIGMKHLLNALDEYERLRRTHSRGSRYPWTAPRCLEEAAKRLLISVDTLRERVTEARKYLGKHRGRYSEGTRVLAHRKVGGMASKRKAKTGT